MDDVKLLLGLILLALLALTVVTIENTSFQRDMQQTQICLDHPTYRKCAD